jgi:GNAT superfamily N-acetyltransferase
VEDSVRVAQVAAKVTFALRQQVLRPHETVAQMALSGDDHPDAGHFAARAADGSVVGTATVRREAPPWAADAPDAWRLRGMATAEGWRGYGIGGRILAAIVDHVSSRGGGLLWCNARVPAVAFYRRAGLETRGEEWDEPHIGPHVAMSVQIPPRASEM